MAVVKAPVVGVMSTGDELAEASVLPLHTCLTFISLEKSIPPTKPSTYCLQILFKIFVGELTFLHRFFYMKGS